MVCHGVELDAMNAIFFNWMVRCKMCHPPLLLPERGLVSRLESLASTAGDFFARNIRLSPGNKLAPRLFYTATLSAKGSSRWLFSGC
ncbi:hypothetical protein THICB350052 [Thiomonas sp. CB3]|nr:hypothetical protein THICB350052 [Thiomonas sp. CB3]